MARVVCCFETAGRLKASMPFALHQQQFGKAHGCLCLIQPLFSDGIRYGQSLEKTARNKAGQRSTLPRTRCRFPPARWQAKIRHRTPAFTGIAVSSGRITRRSRLQSVCCPEAPAHSLSRFSLPAHRLQSAPDKRQVSSQPAAFALPYKARCAWLGRWYRVHR